MQAIDNFILRLGRAAAWLNLLLVGVILLQVILRYGFHKGLVPLEELMWHLYATAFLAGLSYSMVVDNHVRVDILQGRLSDRAKAWIEVIGIVCLFLPFAVVVFHHSLDWVAASYRVAETSENPTGLPYRWLIKGMIPAGFVLMLLAAVSRLYRQLRILAQRGSDGD